MRSPRDPVAGTKPALDATQPTCRLTFSASGYPGPSYYTFFLRIAGPRIHDGKLRQSQRSQQSRRI